MSKQKYWKITNNTKDLSGSKPQPIKIVIRTNSRGSKGIILEPGKFVVGLAQMTTVLDAQRRKGFVTIDQEFDNDTYGFELGEQYDEDYVGEIKGNVNNYMN